MGLDGINKRMFYQKYKKDKIIASDIVSVVLLINNIYIYIYIYISVQEYGKIQTATLWIHHVHPTHKKCAGNRSNSIHNNNHCDLNIQDR